jgi:hypothetical protein
LLFSASLLGPDDCPLAHHDDDSGDEENDTPGTSSGGRFLQLPHPSQNLVNQGEDGIDRQNWMRYLNLHAKEQERWVLEVDVYCADELVPIDSSLLGKV